MRPSLTLTIADLYLAFRQAKTALYFERRGVGLLEIAEFERDLERNLKSLLKTLGGDSWFDHLPFGEAWIVPKRIRTTPSDSAEIVQIGIAARNAGRPIDVQVRLSPHPSFAIVEVLYLWHFGGSLDSLLSDEVVGYRLDLRNQQVVPHRRWLFEYWPPQYQQFRSAPLESAKSALASGLEVLIISGDFASYYDTVAPEFMLTDSFVAELESATADKMNVGQYRLATASLLNAYGRFRAEASRRLSIPISIGVPIGALTSRLIANLALAPLDRHIPRQSGVICYRRYVDDIVVVAKVEGERLGSLNILREYLPLKEATDDILRLDVDSLDRPKSDFQLQQRKVRIHRLAGVPGSDFLDAVTSDFQQAVSERRSFIDSASLVGDGVSHLIRAQEAVNSPLRVLRDADRVRLERFALSTSLRSLERVSGLIDRKQAKEIVRRSLERIGRVLDAENNWVDDLDVSLRLLKLAISSGDWDSTTELRERMDLAWGSISALRLTTSAMYYRNLEIDPAKARPWTWLRNYLHARRTEAVCSSLPIGFKVEQIESRLPGGLRERTMSLGGTALRRRSALLAAADLRLRDREEDIRSEGQAPAVDYSWLRASLDADEGLRARLALIGEFVQRCEDLKDHPWLLSPARLFLCTRPPSYFDVARRWLYRVESDGFDPDVFERLLLLVNSIRGTDNQDPIGSVIDASTVSINPVWPTQADLASKRVDPRVILGNLVVEDSCWSAAATRVFTAPFGKPILSFERLLSVARVLDKTARVSPRRMPALLVLPELSIPRQWFRAISNHVVRDGRFGLIAGLEYLHDPLKAHVRNQVFAVFPGPYSAVATWPWTKRLAAREEGTKLAALSNPVSFPPPPARSPPRAVVKSPWGSLSVLICSELLETRRISDLLGRVDLVLCPAWNPDTASYDHLIQSVGFQLHCIIAIANNGHFSDCRAWAPRTVRWQRDLCRLIEREVDDVVHVDIPLASLTAFHASYADESGWRPLPPDWP